MQSAGRFKAATILATLAFSACHRGTQEEMSVMTGACSNRLHSRGVSPRLPEPPPSLRPGYGGVVGTLADVGGALPHFSILATTPGGSPTAAHATVTADSVGGFAFDALFPGKYRLIVHPFAHKPDSADIEVVAGKLDTVQLRPLYFECVR